MRRQRRSSAFGAFATAAAGDQGLSASAALAAVAKRHHGAVTDAAAAERGLCQRAAAERGDASAGEAGAGSGHVVERGEQKEEPPPLDAAFVSVLLLAAQDADCGGLGAKQQADKVEEAPRVDEDVQRWRRAVAELCERAANGEESEIDGEGAETEDLEDLHELRDLLAKGDNGSPRWQLTSLGDRPVLVTAPHGMYLLRDGWDPHLAEEYTTEVARAMAEEFSGTCLSWKLDEQRCSELLVSHGRRQGRDISELLDPRNRDPNYLAAEELDTNPWFQQMRGAAYVWRSSLGEGGSLLHIDVHGCKTPPATPSHLTVGLGAMQAHTEQRGGSAASAALAAFSAALESELGSVLAPLRLRPTATLVRVAGLESSDGEHVRFAGAWPPDTGRLTQSQQAMGFVGFSHSVQLEMSKVLRRALLKDRENKAMVRFCNGIRTAWARAKSAAAAAALQP